MARTAIEITREALVGLGVERLATMLVEHAATDGSLARKLQLALAAGAGEDGLVKALTRRVRKLGRDDRFIDWNEASSFAREIDQLRATIVDDLAPRAPRLGADLLADLVHTSDEVFERADDSSGAIGDVYREMIEDWGRVWCRIPGRRPEALAGTVLREFRDDRRVEEAERFRLLQHVGRVLVVLAARVRAVEEGVRQQAGIGRPHLRHQRGHLLDRPHVERAGDEG